MREKQAKLKEILATMGKVIVAFSGGVDSTFLLKTAQNVLGEKVLAASVVSELIPQTERDQVQDLALSMEVKLILLEEKLLGREEFINNPLDRCYYCKKQIFTLLQELAQEEGISWIIDGSNADDLHDYRPGLRALQELGIRSPLLEAGLNKEEIRQLSEEMGLPTWNKPALACLASRFPYGTTISEEKLRQIENGEAYLHALGFQQVRLRYHQEIVRIEVLPSEMPLLLKKRDKVNRYLQKIGFNYITMDLIGYRCGSLNEGLGK